MDSPDSASSTVRAEASETRGYRNIIVIGLLLISALYFADTLLRASLKTFWYDELVTVYLCRLPSFSATWSAVLHGADLNPPLFYLLTRWSEHLFGEGLIATRLPQILGFWLFCLCVYRFASRRLGPLRGAVAGFFPVFTLAHYYAYEARPHGILLAVFGLMMLCWQHARESNRQVSLWLVGLWLSYIIALLIHVYAVYLLIPFLLVEAVALARRRRPHFGIVAALMLAPPCVAPVYLRLYGNFTTGTSPGIHIHLYELAQHYFVYVLGPAILLFVLMLLFLAWKPPQDDPIESSEFRSLSRDELGLALALGALPAIGVIGLKFTHAYYFDRYFLAAVAGYALLLAQATRLRGSRAFVARAMLASMILLLSADTLIAAYCHWRHADIDQIEPSSHIAFVPNPAYPLARNEALLRDPTKLDILVTNEPDYLYLHYYAPQSIRSRLVFGSFNDKGFFDGYQRLAHWGKADLRLATCDEFLARHDDFLVYRTNNTRYISPYPDCMESFLKAGYTLRSVDEDADNVLEHFSK